MKINCRAAMNFSGFSWLAIGSLLIYRGVKHFAVVIDLKEEAAWLPSLLPMHFQSYGWPVFILVSVALLLGWIKGYYIFSKTVRRVAARIAKLPSPFPLKQIYTPGYFALMVIMSTFGACFRLFPLSSDVKGFLDFTIGTALLIGSLFYFRYPINLPQKKSCAEK